MGFLKLVKEGLLSYFRSESYLMFSFQYILSLKGALDQFDEWGSVYEKQLYSFFCGWRVSKILKKKINENNPGDFISVEEALRAHVNNWKC